MFSKMLAHLHLHRNDLDLFVKKTLLDILMNIMEGNTVKFSKTRFYNISKNVDWNIV